MQILLEKTFLFLPLLAAMLYALAALALKSATQAGAGVLRITFLANWVGALGFLVFLPWRSPTILPTDWGPVLGLGVFFILGQVCTVLAVSRGEVSVATPMLSTKVIMVAFLLAGLFREQLTLTIWLAGVITVGGIGLLQIGDKKFPLHHLGLTIAFSLAAAFFFALFDVYTQEWSRKYGFGRVVPAAMVVAALLSLVFVPFFDRPLVVMPRQVLGRLFLGIGLLTAQSLLIVSTIGFWGHAASCNIVYGSRGIWSLAVVLLLGRFFANEERHMSGRVKLFRLAGSGLIFGAIILVFQA